MRRLCSMGIASRAGHRTKAFRRGGSVTATPMARSTSEPTIADCWSPGQARAASPSSTLSRASFASAKACREPASCRRKRWTAPSAHSASAPINSGAATSRCRVRWPPKPAGGPRTAASSRTSSPETGIALDIIEPHEEARLAVLGCHKLLEPGDGPALIFDIGGGSTELVLVDQEEGDAKDSRLVERAVGCRFPDRKRGQGGARGPRPAQGLWPHARARPPRLRQFRDDAAAKAARASACSAPAAR